MYRFSKQMRDYRNSIVGQSIKLWYRHLLGRSLSLSAIRHHSTAKERSVARRKIREGAIGNSR